MNRLFRIAIIFFMLLMSVNMAYTQDTPPAPDDDPVLRPFILRPGDIAGVRPAGWQQLRPGTYFQPDSRNALIHRISSSDLNTTAGSFLLAGGADTLPPASDRVTASDSMVWDIYEITGNTDTGVLLAVAESPDNEARLYVIALQSTSDQLDEWRETVFYPAVELFGQPLPDVYRAAGLPPMEQIQFESARLEVVIPQDWEPLPDTDSVYEAPADAAAAGVDTPVMPRLGIQSVSLDTLAADTTLLFGDSIPNNAVRVEPGTAILEGAYLTWTIERLRAPDATDTTFLLAITKTETRRYGVLLRVPSVAIDDYYQQIFVPLLDVAYPLN
jgi:hypothetical protein